MQTRSLRFRSLFSVGCRLAGRWGVLALVGAYGLVVAFGVSPSAAAYVAPLSAPVQVGMVAADHYDASAAGAEVLGRGGNAMDAAAATALALGVVSPSASGLGGGGFLVYWDRKSGQAYVLDFREVAPKRATRDMFVVDGKAVAARSRHGGLAVAVPAEIIGLETAEKRFGKAGLALAVQPAERLARDGFSASPYLASMAALGRERLPGGPMGSAIRELLSPRGVPLAAGGVVQRPALATTLHAIGAEGAAALTRGPLAASLVATTQKAGGVLELADLERYRPEWRAPLVGRFRGHTLYGMAPPGGGATAIEALQILDHGPALGPLGAGSSAAHHAVIEALKHAFADRARWLGDPAFIDVPTGRLLSDEYAADRAATFDPAHTLPVERYGTTDAGGRHGALDVPHDHGTSHLCVVDGEGNVASLTTTVNLPFGSGLLDPQTGIVLNDEMDDFAAQPDAPNAFGLVGGSANAVAPGKRPLSSMTPMIVVRDGRPVLCVGGSGGPRIVTATVQTIVNVIDHQLGATAAVSAPRIHAQWQPDRVMVEPEVPADVVDALERRGHVVQRSGEPAAVQAIVIGSDTLTGASDPRKGGAPAAPKRR